jgi:hypothetical protein
MQTPDTMHKITHSVRYCSKKPMFFSFTIRRLLWRLFVSDSLYILSKGGLRASFVVKNRENPIHAEIIVI